MSSSPSISRRSPPQVPPVVHEGVRYEQGNHDDRAGDQPGGYLVAVDAKTGQCLWRIKVYNVSGGPPSTPQLALYFRSMHLSADGKALIVENEAGGVYRVDLASHVVVQVSGPPEPAATTAEPDTRPSPEP